LREKEKEKGFPFDFWNGQKGNTEKVLEPPKLQFLGKKKGVAAAWKKPTRKNRIREASLVSDLHVLGERKGGKKKKRLSGITRKAEYFCVYLKSQKT